MTGIATLFEVGFLQRLPLGTPYPSIVMHVGRILGQLPAGTELIIDETGVGRPVGDMFVYSGIIPVRVQITAGTAESRDGLSCHVPKLILVSRLQALLHRVRSRSSARSPRRRPSSGNCRIFGSSSPLPAI
jgi:hypothetical protein